MLLTLFYTCIHLFESIAVVPGEVQEILLPDVRVDSAGSAAGARGYLDLLRVVHPVLHLEKRQDLDVVRRVGGAL